MIEKNDKLLAQMARRPCELCQRSDGNAAHHLWTRGMGGGGRLDVPLNLITVCHNCHSAIHWGKIKRADLLAVVSRREGAPADEIERIILELRRKPKGA